MQKGMKSMEIIKHYFVENECYKVGKKHTIKGFMIHSTGANNPNLKRYIDDADRLGKNQYGNHWNQYRPDGRQVCVHGFIGKDKNGNILAYNTLPDNIQAWHCGGSANNGYISYEICEDGLTDATYFNKAMDAAMSVAAYYVKKYGIAISNVISHAEGHKKGIASNHGDIDYWLKKHGKTMAWFRQGVQAKISGGNVSGSTGTVKPSKPTVSSAPDVKYQGFAKGKWWENIINYNTKNTDGYVGVLGYPLRGVRFNTVGDASIAGKLKGRCHVIGGGWYNFQIDRELDKNGENFAGDLKKDIDGLQFDLTGLDGYEIKYRAHLLGGGWLDWVIGYGVGSDGYAGILGKKIDALQMYVIKK